MPYSEELHKNNVYELQHHLYSIAALSGEKPDVIPDGFYSPETAEAIKKFQSRYNLQATGETDRKTWDMISLVHRHMSNRPAPIDIFPYGEYIIRQGDENPLVYLIQSMLASLHYTYSDIPSVDVNGTYDSSTADAVRYIQKLSLYPETGFADKYTWNNIVRTFSHSVK